MAECTSSRSTNGKRRRRPHQTGDFAPRIHKRSRSQGGTSLEMGRENGFLAPPRINKGGFDGKNCFLAPLNLGKNKAKQPGGVG